MTAINDAIVFSFEIFDAVFGTRDALQDIADFKAQDAVGKFVGVVNGVNLGNYGDSAFYYGITVTVYFIIEWLLIYAFAQLLTSS